MKTLKYIYRNKVVLLVVLIFTLNSACNKWLDIEPENDLIQQEFWKTKDDVLAVLASAYDAVRDNSLKSFENGEIRADLITLANSNPIAGNKMSSTTDGIGWGHYYKAINLANTVMYYAPQVQDEDKTLTDQLLDQINSEMLFLRSLSYFYLVRTWKEVPLVLQATVSDTVNFYIPKSSEKVILNQLIEDLKYASTIATDKKLTQGRANKYAIEALLADVLLWDENYDECIKACDVIINSGNFELEKNENWYNLYYPGNSPKESLFECQYEDSYEGQSSEMTRVNVEYTINKDYYGFDSKNDVRFAGNAGPGWKYIGTDETGLRSSQRKSGEISANFIIYRYAEILMMKAECLAEKGSFTEANYLVRQVVERAGETYEDKLTIKTFRTSLLQERAKEFAGEGKRWYELLRFAKRNNFENQQLLIEVLLSKAQNAQESAIMKANVLDPMSYYFPIEEEEIRLNRNLVQNPFYDR